MLMTMKRWIAAILSLILLISAVEVPVFAATEPETYAQTEDAPETDEEIAEIPVHLRNKKVASSYKHPKRANIPDLTEYKKSFVRQAMSCPEVIDISEFRFPNNQEILDALVYEIYYETPEAFVDGFEFYSYDNEIILSLTPIYCDFANTAYKYKKCHNEMIAAADILLEGIEGNSSLNEVNKALLLHDRLALWTIYDPNWDPNNTVDSNHSAYGPLGMQIGVCQGNAYAYMYLLERVGIRVDYCSSEMLCHGWNIVYIAGVPYHVDVTWDEAIMPYDVLGLSRHDNFLRSTYGMKETGHSSTGNVYGSIDFNNTPNDTRYDEYYWQNSYTAFQFVGGKLYYINNVDERLYVIEGSYHKALFSVAGNWNGEGNYARLASVGNVLLYSTPTAIMQYDPATGTKTEVFTPSCYGNEKIYGFKYERGKIICDLNNTYYFEGPVRQASVDFLPTCTTHSYTVIVSETAPTCTVAGRIVYKCAKCAETKTDTVAALGHSFTNYRSNGDATCTTDGTKTAKCDRCTETKKITDSGSKLGHSYTVYVSGTPATCTTAGTATYKCSRCTSTQKDPAGEPLGHSFTNYKSNGDATCQKDGTKTAKCDRCTATKTVTDTGSKTDHKWNSGVHTDATAEKEGYTTYTCVWCGITKVVVDVIQAQIIGHPASVITDSGSTVSFTVTTKGTVKSWQWQYRKLYKWYNTSLNGYNTNTLTVPATGARNGYDYRCVVTFEDGTVLESDPAKLTVNTVITITGHPKDQTISLGNKGQFSASASGEGIKYQWQYKRPGSDKWIDTNMEGATKATVLIETTVSRNGYQYRCKITDVTGNESFTDAATLRVLSITKHPAAVTSDADKTVKFTVETSVSGGFTYQWQYSKDGVSWSNTTMTGYNTATLEVAATAARNGYLYRCVLTDTRNGKVISNSAKLTVKTATVTPETNPAMITAQPKSVTAVIGGNVKFSVKATGAMSYKWYYSKDGTSWSETSLSGFNTATLTVNATAARNGYRYRCTVTGEDGTKVNSVSATLTVVEITQQPVSAYGFVDGNVKYTVKLSGTSGITYRWQYTKDGTKWYDTTMTGYNTKTLTVGVLSNRNGYGYRCVIRDAAGNTLTSETASLYAISVDRHPIDKTVLLNGYTVFSTAVTMSADVAYQWQYRRSDTAAWTNTTMEGCKTEKLVVQATNARNGYQYRCMITDGAGNQVYTNGAVLRIATITEQPANTAAAAGMMAEFFVGADLAEDINYQWQYSKDGIRWYDTTMTGYNTATLQVEATTKRNGYLYRCVLADTSGNETESDSAMLSVLEVITQPISVTVEEGHIAEFVVGINLTEGYTFQWQYSKDGTKWYATAMTGYNTAILEVEATSNRNGYQYRCVVLVDGEEAVISDAATLTVTVPKPVDPAKITSQPESAKAFIGGYATFKIVATGAVSYQWQYRRNETANWTSTSMTGYNTDTLTVGVTAARNGYQYRCVVTGEDGVKVYSDAATLRLIQITEQPETGYGFVGSNTKFSIQVSDVAGIKYQWQYRRSETANWTNTTMTGYNTKTLTVAVTAARSGYQYRCKLIDSFGNVLESDGAALCIVDITVQPVDQNGEVGDSVVFIVETNNPDQVSYQWQYRRSETSNWSNTTMEGYDASALWVDITAGRNGYQYRCIISLANGNKLESDFATLTVS